MQKVVHGLSTEKLSKQKYDKAYHKKNAKRLNANKKIYWIKNKIAITVSRQRPEKKKHIIEYMKNYGHDYYLKNKTKINARCHEWYQRYAAEHPDKILNNMLRTKFGITLLDYNVLLKRQNNRCAICSMTLKKSLQVFKKRLSVDHCHKSNKVRGLLCHVCNIGLGSFKDSEKQLRAAIKYLRRHK